MKQIKLKSITLEYFMCFGPKVKLEFPEEFNILISGHWKNQKHRSNWSGKSTLLEAIKFLFYGETRGRYNKDIPNDNFNKPAKVSGVIILDNGKELKICREVGTNVSALEVEGWTSTDKKIIQSRLNALFGYDYNDFVSTCFFNQGDIHQFMEAKPTEKLTALERWMEILGWDDCESITKLKKQEVQTYLNDIQDNVEKKSETRQELKDVRSGVERIDAEIEELRTEARELQTKLDKTKIRLAATNKAEEQRSNKKEIENKLFKIGDVKKLRSDLGNIEQDIEYVKRSIENDKENSKGITELKSKSMKLYTRISSLREEQLTSAASVAMLEEKLGQIGNGDSCPIDGEHCTRSKTIKDYAKECNAKLKEQRKDNKALREKIHKLVTNANGLDMDRESKKSAQRNAEKSELKLDALKEKRGRVKTKLERAEELETELGKIQKAQLSTKEKSVEKLKTYSLKLQEQLEETEKDIRLQSEKLGGLKQQIKTLQQSLKAINEDERKIPVLTKKKEILTFCLLMFGKRGIRSSQLKSRIENIEHEANLILDELDSKLQIEIQTDRELTSWESHCIYCGREFQRGYSKRKCDDCGNERTKKRKEEFDIKIINDGKVRSFNQESGGVNVLVSLAIRLSLVKLRQMVTGKSIGILFLDEIYGMLDPVNRELVYRFLLDYAKNKLGFKQIFQITHLNDGFDAGTKIEVIKRRRYSEVRWA